MSANKTVATKQSVTAFIKTVEDEQKRKDCQAILKIMKEITGKQPKMWGPSIVGFDQYHYKYESGREGDFFITGFSPRKQNLTIYIMPGFERYEELMQKLGPHKAGKSCLYVKRLDDIHLPTLKKLIKESVGYMRDKYNG